MKCPLRFSWQDWAAGLFDIWDRLRADGVRIIANGAWQMANPYDGPGAWEFPAMDHLDGVMIEYRSGISMPDGWWGLTDERLVEVARAWMDRGRAVIVVATLMEDDPQWGGDFMAFARHYYRLAQEHGFHIAINQRHINYGNTPWLQSLYGDVAKAPIFGGEPGPGPEPGLPGGEMQVIRERLDRLEARISYIERWIASFGGVNG